MAVFSGGYVKTAACFFAGTLVATANGLAAIETIKAGDYVLSTDPDTMQTIYKPVLGKHSWHTHEKIKPVVNKRKMW